jgi:hypothetical protein
MWAANHGAMGLRSKCFSDFRRKSLIHVGLVLHFRHFAHDGLVQALLGLEDRQVLEHLRAENAYLEAHLASQKDLEEELFNEIKDRVEETDISVPVRKGNWWYFVRTREGLNYPISVRVPVIERGPDPARHRPRHDTARRAGHPR